MFKITTECFHRQMTHGDVAIPNHRSINLLVAGSRDQLNNSCNYCNNISLFLETFIVSLSVKPLLKNVGQLPDGEKRVREHSLC